MKKLDPTTHWQRAYEKPEQAVSWYQPAATMSLELIEQASLSYDAPIIDVGGGASRLVDGLLDRGHIDVTVLDVSEHALGVGQSRLAARAKFVQWVVSDITTWSPSRPYACWHDRAVLHFLTEQDDRASYIEALATATLPGAAIIIATFAEDGPERCSGLPVVRYSRSALEALLRPIARLEEAKLNIHTTPTGASQSFLWARFCRS